MYTEKDLVRVAKRENNNKRKYLVVNALQAKHIPVEPEKTFAMFDELANILIDEYRDEKVLVVGFAETATAIGARLAIRLNSYYMQTTREQIPDVEYLYFTESHSHATEQKLIKTDLDTIIDRIDRIIFAEDEVTTGNTIQKIIDIIRDIYGDKVKFSVASLLNGMDETAQRGYEDQEIQIHYLVKTDHSSYSEIADSYQGNGCYITDLKEQSMPEVKEFRATDYMDGRRLVQGRDYESACNSLWRQIQEQMDFTGKESVLVLGTEEFMYPAIDIAYHLGEIGLCAKCHSTTRSPIAVSQEKTYPLHTRYELRSLYEDVRTTYIYDLESYDKVLVITDSANPSEAGLSDLCNAILKNGNSDICIVRWWKG